MAETTFKLGKCYKHTSGEMICIVGAAQTKMWGLCLIAEGIRSTGLKPVGMEECHAENWKEIPMIEYQNAYEYPLYYEERTHGIFTDNSSELRKPGVVRRVNL